MPGFTPAHTCKLQRKTHIVQCRSLEEQVKTLKDHADGSADLAQFLLGKAGQLRAVYTDGTGRGPLQKVDTAHQRGFSSAGKTDDAEDFPCLHA